MRHKYGGKFVRDRNKKICEDRKAGKLQKDIANEVGLSRERVRQIIKRAEKFEINGWGETYHGS